MLHSPLAHRILGYHQIKALRSRGRKSVCFCEHSSNSLLNLGSANSSIEFSCSLSLAREQLKKKGWGNGMVFMIRLRYIYCQIFFLECVVKYKSCTWIHSLPVANTRFFKVFSKGLDMLEVQISITLGLKTDSGDLDI